MPAKKPVKHRKKMSCQMVVLKPKPNVPMQMPRRDMMRIGRRPNRSAAEVQGMRKRTLTKNCSDSCKRASVSLVMGSSVGLKTYNQTAVEPNISLRHPQVFDLLLYVRLNRKGNHRVDDPGETENRHLIEG